MEHMTEPESTGLSVRVPMTDMKDILRQVWKSRKMEPRMNELYEMDERSDDPDHPMHGLFTGLHQEVLIYEKWKKQFGLEI